MENNNNKLYNLQKLAIGFLEKESGFSYEVGAEAQRTFEEVRTMNTATAVEHMANFTIAHGCGGCIHFASLMYSLNPDILTLGFVPHVDKDTDTISQKFINIVDGRYVLDLITPLEAKKDKMPSIITLLSSYLIVPINEYMKQHLFHGDVLTVLPAPAKMKDMPFMEYCFRNPCGVNYTIRDK